MSASSSSAAMVRVATPGRINGRLQPDTMRLRVGETYRIRLIEIMPDYTLRIAMMREDSVVHWKALAKDGAELPLERTGDAARRIHFRARPDDGLRVPADGARPDALSRTTPRGSVEDHASDSRRTLNRRVSPLRLSQDVDGVVPACAAHQHQRRFGRVPHPVNALSGGVTRIGDVLPRDEQHSAAIRVAAFAVGRWSLSGRSRHNASY